MELKNYIKTLKVDNKVELVNEITLSILKLEEVFVEKNKNQLLICQNSKNILDNCFIFCLKNKIEINHITEKVLDLDYWKNNIILYKVKSADMGSDVFLYSVRNSLMSLIEVKKIKNFMKTHIFEIIVKMFLLLDFYNINIDELLMNQLSLP